MKNLTLSLIALCFTANVFAQGGAIVPVLERTGVAVLEKMLGKTEATIAKELDVVLKSSFKTSLDAIAKSGEKQILQAAVETLMSQKKLSFAQMNEVYAAAPEVFAGKSELVKAAQSPSATVWAQKLGLKDESGVITNVQKVQAMEVSANLKGKSSGEVAAFQELVNGLPADMNPVLRNQVIVAESSTYKHTGETLIGKKCSNLTNEVDAQITDVVVTGNSAVVKNNANIQEALEAGMKKTVGEQNAVKSSCHLTIGKYQGETSGCANTFNPSGAPADC
ncbi:MAG: hypothetical protein JNM93_04085 [Bacteriovoracaceae bacterium]|nr:hypothetical protein [Bacteriovoracaceae bacterium]